MDIDSAQKVWDNEEPDFEEHECEVEGCGDDAEEELKGHWLCRSCYVYILTNPRSDIAVGVLGKVR